MEPTPGSYCVDDLRQENFDMNSLEIWPSYFIVETECDVSVEIDSLCLLGRCTTKRMAIWKCLGSVV